MRCDCSIKLFLVHLASALAIYSATVKWYTVVIKPSILIHWQHEPHTLYVRHSVFEITARSGKKYIADFTIEQFGFPAFMWFMHKETYMHQCTFGTCEPQPG